MTGRARGVHGSVMANQHLIDALRGLLNDVLKARFEGASYAKLSRANGLADGYMRALLDAKLVDRDALLRVIGDERQRFVATDAA